MTSGVGANRLCYIVPMIKKNPRLGSKFDDYLAEAGLLEEVTATAMKRVLAWQIAQAMKKQRVTKSAMAKRMRTSRAALDRLLDADNTLRHPPNHGPRSGGAGEGAVDYVEGCGLSKAYERQKRPNHLSTNAERTMVR